MVIDDSSGDEMSLGTRSQTSEQGEDDGAIDGRGEPSARGIGESARH